MKAPIGAFFFVMNLTSQQIHNTILAWQISALIALAISMAITFWLLYLVIRAGVRDGILAAQRSERRRRPARDRDRIDLPDMRAD